MTQTFSATSAAAGRRLSTRTLAGCLTCHRQAGVSATSKATRDAYAQQVPGAGHRLAAADGRRIAGLVAWSFWHRTSGAL